MVPSRPFSHLKTTPCVAWWGKSRWWHRAMFNCQEKAKPEPKTEDNDEREAAPCLPWAPGNYGERCTVVFIAGWSGSALHDYHKCLHWEEGSGRIYQAANPLFPSPYSQWFLLSWPLAAERCSPRWLQQIYTPVPAEPDQGRVAVVTTLASTITLPGSPWASEELQVSYKASGWKLGHLWCLERPPRTEARQCKSNKADIY